MSQLKRITALVMAAILFAGILSVSANGDVNVAVNGAPVVFTAQTPVNIDGRVLVPARGVFDALGFTPSWDGELRQATLTSDRFVIVITIDSTVFTTNGVQHHFDVPAQIINDSTMIPLGAVLRSIDIDPGWDAATNTVIITVADNEYAPIDEPAPAPSLVLGDWDFMGLRYYHFNEDGSGFRGYFGNYENFRWQTASGVLTITTAAFTEYWNYETAENFLIITSRQVDGFAHIYTRHGVTVPGVSAQGYIPAQGIVGTWDWNGRPYYAFRADGTGVRGMPGEYQHFRWRTAGGVLYITGAGHVEEWTYTVDGNGLRLSNVVYGVFEYVRR